MQLHCHRDRRDYPSYAPSRRCHYWCDSDSLFQDALVIPGCRFVFMIWKFLETDLQRFVAITKSLSFGHLGLASVLVYLSDDHGIGWILLWVTCPSCNMIHFQSRVESASEYFTLRIRLRCEIVAGCACQCRYSCHATSGEVHDEYLKNWVWSCRQPRQPPQRIRVSEA